VYADFYSEDNKKLTLIDFGNSNGQLHDDSGFKVGIQLITNILLTLVQKSDYLVSYDLEKTSNHL
jgi:hypothetical protein